MARGGGRVACAAELGPGGGGELQAAVEAVAGVALGLEKRALSVHDEARLAHWLD